MMFAPKNLRGAGLALTAATLLMHSGHAAAADLAGTVKVDGSSTVYPISEAMAEEFQKAQKGVKVTVGSAGTGAGYKKFCAGELDIADASRAIKADEVAKCKAAGVELMELPVAYDGLTVVVHPSNTFVKSLSFEQLKKIWEPGSKVKTWKDVDPSFPDQAIKLFGPSSEHGTFDYFTEEVNGKAKASRSDYNAAADTNTLVGGVAGDKFSLGYFGYAYFVEGKNKVKAVAISKDGKQAPVLPEGKTIENGSYPLSRPLFITVNKKSAERAEVNAFVDYYLKNAKDIGKSVGYTAVPQKMADDANARYSARKVGVWQSSH
ncbi:MAG: PstS family phosphate ABC transporter substrate-binding protein [Proteobacteria bacterium]|nr:PstS family phosphate ABC transporter substrate-binding protein [Pseudomonadota bacterium]